ncbi:MAG: phosphotransferase family protein [Alphaproteobacteria bacterium]
MPDIDAIHQALTRLPGCGDVRPGDLEVLPATGIAHDHIRVRGLVLDSAPALLRLPRLSQWGLEAQANLAYQRAGFERAAPSGVTPRLLAVLPVSARLPMGALVVEEIAGRKPRLPGDMPAISRSLAAIHTLPVPARRAPLQVHDDPVAAIVGAIEAQAGFLDECDIEPEARAAIGEELAWAREFADHPASRSRSHPQCLVASDTHPGNFLIETGAKGRAVLVDLEKMLYGSPAIDLAHASLATSTMWDPDCAGILGQEQTVAFIEDYFAAVGATAAAALRAWIVPMRRLTWLRTMTWCGRWLVLSRGRQDWSARHLDPAFADHLKSTVRAYFTPARIAASRREWLDPGGLGAIYQ